MNTAAAIRPAAPSSLSVAGTGGKGLPASEGGFALLLAAAAGPTPAVPPDAVPAAATAAAGATLPALADPPMPSAAIAAPAAVPMAAGPLSADLVGRPVLPPVRQPDAGPGKAVPDDPAATAMPADPVPLPEATSAASKPGVADESDATTRAGTLRRRLLASTSTRPPAFPIAATVQPGATAIPRAGQSPDPDSPPDAEGEDEADDPITAAATPLPSGSEAAVAAVLDGALGAASPTVAEPAAAPPAAANEPARLTSGAALQALGTVAPWPDASVAPAGTPASPQPIAPSVSGAPPVPLPPVQQAAATDAPPATAPVVGGVTLPLPASASPAIPPAPAAIVLPPAPAAPLTDRRADAAGPRPDRAIAAPPMPDAAPASAPPARAMAGTTAPAAQAFAAAIEAADRQDRLAGAREPADPSVAVAAPMAAAVPPASPAAGGEPSLDMRRQGWPAAMVDHIERLRDAADAASTRIRLVPDALGSIDVAVRRHDDGAVQVSLAADRPATQALIADAQPELSRLASERGARLEVSVGGGAAGFGGDGRPSSAPPPVPVTPRRPATSPSDDPVDLADGRVA